MNTPRASDAVQNQALSIFLERIRKSFSHDLRTPLGTIVNYAAVLERSPGGSAEEVRDLGQRIRVSALRAARMIQQLATATELANRAPRASSTDLAALARSVLVDGGGRGKVQVLPDPSAAVANVDAEVLGFAWRALMAVEADAAGGPLQEVELEVHSGLDEVIVELRCRIPRPPEAQASAPALIEIANYLRHNDGPERLETSMSFKLAHDLVVSQGGVFEIWGLPGTTSGLRLRMPVAICSAG